jgi:predicted phosphodiesterase
LLFNQASFAAVAAAEKDMRFLALADIHFDPFSACYALLPKPCPLIIKLQQADPKTWSSILAVTKPVPLLHHDTDYYLLTDMLTTTKQAAAKQPVQFVLVLGDFLSHHFRRDYRKYSLDKTKAGYQQFVKKTLEFLTYQLADTFPNTNIYMVVGNNDSYQDDYRVDPKGAFFKDTGLVWSNLLSPPMRSAMRQQFKTAGYYALDVTNVPGLRLIVLNSVLFSTKAKEKNLAAAATAQLNWLHQQLMQVRAKKQKALIAMHIPMRIDAAIAGEHLATLRDLWQVQYTERFRMELQQFAPDIFAVFSGHLHIAWFEWLRFPLQPAIPMVGTIAVSPIYGNEPGFDIYPFSAQPLQFDDDVTVSYPIMFIRATFPNH